MALAEQINNLREWKYKVQNKDSHLIPPGYQDKRKSGLYEGFTGFIEEFAERLLSGSDTGIVNMRSEESSFQELDYDSKSLPKDWWTAAQKVADGRKPKEPIPRIAYSDKQNNLTVYNALLPAYRAIRESFENRSILQWFTNHEEYTAERDAMKALEGLMLSLTGDTKEALEEAYFDYKDEVELGEKSELNEEQHDELDESVINDDDDDSLYEEDDFDRVSILVDLEKDEPKHPKTLFETMDEVRKEQVKKQSGRQQ